MKGDKQLRERGSKDRIQGEGDYEAGKVDEADSAAPDSAAESAELKRAEHAERAGRAHSKGESTDKPPGVESRS